MISRDNALNEIVDLIKFIVTDVAVYQNASNAHQLAVKNYTDFTALKASATTDVKKMLLPDNIDEKIFVADSDKTAKAKALKEIGAVFQLDALRSLQSDLTFLPATITEIEIAETLNEITKEVTSLSKLSADAFHNKEMTDPASGLIAEYVSIIGETFELMKKAENEKMILARKAQGAPSAPQPATLSLYDAVSNSNRDEFMETPFEMEETQNAPLTSTTVTTQVEPSASSVIPHESKFQYETYEEQQPVTDDEQEVFHVNISTGTDSAPSSRKNSTLTEIPVITPAPTVETFVSDHKHSAEKDDASTDVIIDIPSEKTGTPSPQDSGIQFHPDAEEVKEEKHAPVPQSTPVVTSSHSSSSITSTGFGSFANTSTHETALAEEFKSLKLLNDLKKHLATNLSQIDTSLDQFRAQENEISQEITAAQGSKLTPQELAEIKNELIDTRQVIANISIHHGAILSILTALNEITLSDDSHYADLLKIKALIKAFNETTDPVDKNSHLSALKTTIKAIQNAIAYEQSLEVKTHGIDARPNAAAIANMAPGTNPSVTATGEHSGKILPFVAQREVPPSAPVNTVSSATGLSLADSKHLDDKTVENTVSVSETKLTTLLETMNKLSVKVEFNKKVTLRGIEQHKKALEVARKAKDAAKIKTTTDIINDEESRAEAQTLDADIFKRITEALKTLQTKLVEYEKHGSIEHTVFCQDLDHAKKMIATLCKAETDANARIELADDVIAALKKMQIDHAPLSIRRALQAEAKLAGQNADEGEIHEEEKDCKSEIPALIQEVTAQKKLLDKSISDASMLVAQYEEILLNVRLAQDPKNTMDLTKKYGIIMCDEKEKNITLYGEARTKIFKLNRSRSVPTSYPMTLKRVDTLSGMSDALGNIIQFLSAHPKHKIAIEFAKDATDSMPNRSDKNWVNLFFAWALTKSEAANECVVKIQLERTRKNAPVRRNADIPAIPAQANANPAPQAQQPATLNECVVKIQLERTRKNAPVRRNADIPAIPAQANANPAPQAQQPATLWEKIWRNKFTILLSVLGTAGAAAGMFAAVAANVFTFGLATIALAPLVGLIAGSGIIGGSILGLTGVGIDSLFRPAQEAQMLPPQQANNPNNNQNQNAAPEAQPLVNANNAPVLTVVPTGMKSDPVNPDSLKASQNPQATFSNAQQSVTTALTETARQNAAISPKNKR